MARRKRSRTTRTGKTKRGRNEACQAPNKEHLVGMLGWLLPEESIFSKMRLHGNTKWLAKYLVCLALVWAWSDARHLTDAYIEAVQGCSSMFACVLPSTYQGFVGALTRWTATLMKILWSVLHERMEEIGGRFWRIHGWVPIAFDGSRSTAPRTAANEQAFCAQDYGKGKTAKYRKKKTKGMRRKKNERNPTDFERSLGRYRSLVQNHQHVEEHAGNEVQVREVQHDPRGFTNGHADIVDPFQAFAADRRSRQER